MENNRIAIEFKNVSKSYKLYKNERERLLALFTKRIKPKMKHAISDVSFSIEKGESVAFFGRNGAGKSTILKMITGVLYPSEGEITINGRVSALLELKAGFDSDFTGRENIYFKGMLLGLTEEEIREMEPAIVEFAELGPHIDQKVKTYSSGMKARLGFAINANISPEILIVDEALSVGDKAFRIKCREKLDEIFSQNEDVTFLFVTHSLGSAKAFCKRGIVLKQGKKVFDGPIDEATIFYENMVDEEIGQIKKKKKAKSKKKGLAKPKAAAAETVTKPETPAQEQQPESVASPEKTELLGE